MRFRWITQLGIVCALATSCAATPTVNQTVQVQAGSGEQAAQAEAVPAMSREQAVDTLVSDAFLPLDTAGCVIDAVFLETGEYNPNGAEAEVIDGCTTLLTDIGRTDEDKYTPQIDDPADRPAVSIGPFELTEASMPAIVPGGRAMGTVDIGGKSIEYVTITPPGFQIGDGAPVFFALPPGGQDLEITRNVADAVYLDQAVRRGWVVVTPASPSGRWYENGNGTVAAEFLAWVHAWVDAEGGKVHLGGMSNGGLSAFHIAARMPGAFHSLLAFPGYPRQGDRAAFENLVDVPVRMWVGGDDTSWVKNMESTAENFRTLGGDVELFVLPGEPHVLQSTADGVAFFDQLDAARS